MRFTRTRIICTVFAAVWAAASAHSIAGEIVDMPSEDRATIDGFLGKGVLGKAVPSEPLGDPMTYVPFDKDASYAVCITSGEQKGQIVDHTVKKIYRDSVGQTWEITAGDTDILNLTLNKDGHLVFLNHAEPDEGLDGHYSPPPPLLIKGMEPGSTEKFDFDISVRYLDKPEKVKHRGHLALNLSYLGTFEMNLPFGKHEAVLIKSAYKGKVGPAKLDDTQYRFFVKDVGIVAMVERKDISAFLVYHDKEKVGKLLIKEK